MSREIFHYLKRERDICSQTTIPSKNMAFVLAPALSNAKLLQPLIPIDIHVYAFTLSWDNFCWKRSRIGRTKVQGNYGSFKFVLQRHFEIEIYEFS